MSSSHSQDQPPKTDAQGDAQPEQHKEPYLALPDASTADPTHKLDLSDGGSSVKLDHLGPLVVNQDGTLSRIANWEHMTEIEKKNTLRVLGKRNKLRMDALKEAGAGQEGEGGNK
ncbi:transcription factor jumonji jmjC-domain-containing protein [Aspergillus terreus]|uniref:Transcription factor jumonji jmjC-domain-containing protein n=1 Tax=Aspergillus terreus TaxID=33178 RepID=A0A8H3MM96_ASPTE|nr:transcription factor jumonji jmjC-domain-containing protein [Aspergillus terreus]